MTCRELAEVLLDYVADELAPDHRRRVEEHLGECPPCIAFLASYRLTIELTGKLPNDCLPPQCEQRLRAALGELGSA